MCIALGFFDSLHRGHAAVVSNAVKFADAHEFLCAVFTFENNPFEVLGKDTKLIYTFGERRELLKDIGVDVIKSAQFDKAFMSQTPEQFLESLINSYNIKYISCGYDYKFGKNCAGGVPFLRRFCEKHNIPLEIAPEVQIDGVKVSSTLIRERLAGGDIAAANKFLTAPYCVFGRVEKGRGAGGKMGIPTANISISPEKQPLGAGVYATDTFIGGKKYASVTNAGGKPTFNENAYGIETHIMGFDNTDLYGEYIKIEFLGKIRNIMPFPSKEELRKRIEKDMLIRKGEYR